MSNGSFIFVLHSHVPYVRKTGKWPHGEEMLFEIIAETYIPLLNSFTALTKDNIPLRLSLGLTPILLEQLADTYMQEEFVKYIKNRIKAAEEEYKVFDKELKEFLGVSQFYIDWYTKILTDYESVYNRNLIDAFKYFQDNAQLDILTSAATHGYLPLLGKDSAIWGQLKTGINHYKKYFNRAPTGIWLPECGYRPVKSEERAGIEAFLEEMNIQYFFTDSHVIQASVYSDSGVEPILLNPNPLPYTREVSSRNKKSTKPIVRTEELNEITTFHPYYVADSTVHVFARDKLTGMQVWSADWGYPGDFVYREFHKKSKLTGIQYWKISNKKPGMKFKEVYEPFHAQHAAEDHARHFSHLVSDHLRKYKEETGKKGTVVSSYDTELFGHWWFEGVHWLESVIRNFNINKDVEMMSAREFVKDTPATVSVKLPESSWGNGGQHSTWLNDDTIKIWDDIHRAEQRFESIVQANAHNTQMQQILNQTARELLLLQSSDWPFLITTVQARDYAEKRFEEHLERFNLLCDVIEGKITEPQVKTMLEHIMDVDNIFTDINYKDFS